MAKACTAILALRETHADGSAPRALQDGVAIHGSAAEGTSAHFSVVVPNPAMALTLTLTPLSGDATLFASAGTSRDAVPSAASHDAKSETTSSALVSRVVVEPHVSAQRDCFEATQNTTCTWRVAVAPSQGSAHFTLVASLRWADGPLSIVYPADVAGPVKSVLLPLGIPLPFDSTAEPSPRFVAQLATPQDACVVPVFQPALAMIVHATDSCTVEEQARNVARGPATAMLVVAATAETAPGLELQPALRLRVPPTQHDSLSYSLPFAAAENALAGRIRPDMQISLRSPLLVPPRLLPGVPQAGVAGAGEMVVHTLWGSGQPLTLALTTLYGECELFLSSDALPPTLSHHSARDSALSGNLAVPASMSTQHDQIVVGVYGWRACAYSLVASAASSPATPTTLQRDVPARGSATAGVATYYRFDVTGRHDVRLTLTPVSGGDPNMFVFQVQPSTVSLRSALEAEPSAPSLFPACRVCFAVTAALRPSHVCPALLATGSALRVGLSAQLSL